MNGLFGIGGSERTCLRKQVYPLKQVGLTMPVISNYKIGATTQINRLVLEVTKIEKFNLLNEH